MDDGHHRKLGSAPQPSWKCLWLLRSFHPTWEEGPSCCQRRAVLDDRRRTTARCLPCAGWGSPEPQRTYPSSCTVKTLSNYLSSSGTLQEECQHHPMKHLRSGSHFALRFGCSKTSGRQTFGFFASKLAWSWLIGTWRCWTGCTRASCFSTMWLMLSWTFS